MKIWTIARMTVLEAVRRKIILTGFILGITLVLLHSIGFAYIHYQFEIQMQFLGDSTSGMTFAARLQFYNFIIMAGFYAVNFLTIMMAGLVSSNALSGEINNGSIQTLVTKPIRRFEIVIGKWLGLAFLLGCYILLMMGGMSFGVWLQERYIAPNLAAGIFLIFLESLLFISLALAFSSRLSTLATGSAVFGLFGIAFAGSWIEQIGSYLNNQASINIGIITSLILPSEALWRRAAYEMTLPLINILAGGPFISQSVPSDLMLIYSILYILAAFGLSIYGFSKRDL
ncbi:MAG: ABC transporter permease subunit [Anaerolineaceae bacterium]|nr:ABC transporter permease subunit [Anaerolineaceae bacterium]